MPRLDISNPASMDRTSDILSDSKALNDEIDAVPTEEGSLEPIYSTTVSNSMIAEQGSTKQSYRDQIEALVHQLKINEELHAAALKEHQSILVDKERQIQEKKDAIRNMRRLHDKQLELLARSQQETLSSCRMQYDMAAAKLKWRLEQQEKEAKSTAVEQLLNEFEQEQHTLRISNDTSTVFPAPRPPPTDYKPTSAKNTPYISPLYIPTCAISWPAPPPLSSLRKTSVVCSEKD